MKLTKTFEKFTKQHGLQVLEVSCNANTLSEIEEISYNDFEINLYINHKFIADLSPVIDKTPIYTELIDSINWIELYKEQQTEVAIPC